MLVQTEFKYLLMSCCTTEQTGNSIPTFCAFLFMCVYGNTNWYFFFNFLAFSFWDVQDHACFFMYFFTVAQCRVNCTKHSGTGIIR